MDEPLGALDRALRDSMQSEFRAIHRSLGMTFIYVTHDQQEALTMSDRIAVFDDGRIVQLGHPEEVYRKPASRFVATFLGESNLLPAEVLGRDGEMVALRLLSGEVVRIASADEVEIGSQVEISIRQESVLTGTHSNNALKGTLQDATFYGDHVRLVVRLGHGLTVVAKSNPVELEVMRIGSPITIGIPVRGFALIFKKPARGK
jgi:putative spermidine/putrescine transport system ATP-binding protein